jgi:hypothetical protein
MRIRKRLLHFIIAFAIFIIALVELIYFVDPYQKIEIYTFLIDPKVIFFILIFLASYLIFTYIFLNSIKGIFLALFVIATLLLRMLGYTEGSYVVILLLIVILCILYFKRTPKSIEPKKKES